MQLNHFRPNDTAHSIARNSICPRWLAPLCLTLGVAAVTPPLHAAQPRLQPLIHPGTWEGWPGGAATELAVAGNYAYVGLSSDNSGLAIIDVRDPLRCRQVGAYLTNALVIVTSLAVSGNHAYLATHTEGLFVIDVSNPSNPVRVGGCPTPSPASSLVVSDRYAYLACGTNGLVIMDVSDPLQCARAGGFTADGPVNSLAVAGRYAYLATGTNGLVIVDVNDPASCRKVGAYAASGEYAYIGRVEVAGRYAYTTRQKSDSGLNSVLQLIDVSDPTNCVPLASAGSPGRYAKLAVSGNYSYHVLRDQDGVLEVYVYDVSDPEHLVRVRTIDASFDGGQNGGFSIAVSGGCIFVTDTIRLRVFPAGNPPDPVCAGQYTTARSGHGVTVAGQHAYVAEGWAGLRVINVEDRANPVGVGHYETLGYAQSVAIAGRYAYVAGNVRTGNPRQDTVHDSGLLEVIDVSDPTNCRFAGRFDFGPTRSVAEVAVSGHYAYVTDGRGLQVIDVTSCDDCVRVGGCAIDGAYRVVVAGHHAFVGGAQDVHVIDVSDPTNCVSVSRFGLSAEIRDVAVSGHHACVITDSPNEFHVFDVTDPANPVRAGRCEQDVTWGGAIAANGPLVCVTDEDFDKFHVLDLSDPARCRRLGGAITGGYPADVAVADDRTYVLTFDARLLVFTSVPGVQFTVRVDATPDVPFTVEATTDLNAPFSWTPLLATNISVMPFDFVDYDVRSTGMPRKFYRARQE